MSEKEKELWLRMVTELIRHQGAHPEIACKQASHILIQYRKLDVLDQWLNA